MLLNYFSITKITVYDLVSYAHYLQDWYEINQTHKQNIDVMRKYYNIYPFKCFKNFLSNYLFSHI